MTAPYPCSRICQALPSIDMTQPFTPAYQRVLIKCSDNTEIQGQVYIHNPFQRLSSMLNDPEQAFLPLTDVQILVNGRPNRCLDFLALNKRLIDWATEVGPLVYGSSPHYLRTPQTLNE